MDVSSDTIWDLVMHDFKALPLFSECDRLHSAPSVATGAPLEDHTLKVCRPCCE